MVYELVLRHNCALKFSPAISVTVLGLSPKRDRRRLFTQVGVQFQEGDYQSKIRVDELCEETACLYRKPADWHEVLERFGIGDKEKRLVKSLFGGERPSLCLESLAFAKG